MPRPFLTIGIASYNYSRYLAKAFSRIKRQNFKDIEILYCDDGSDDDSVQWIKRIMADEKELTIRLLDGSHEGIIANRNRIIENAAGEYLMICDADDYMMDGCLEKLCRPAKAGADCVIGGFREVSDSGEILKEHVPGANASKWLYTWHHGQIYRTSLVRDNGISFQQIPDDVFYLQRIHDCCDTVAFVREPVYAWCRHGSSASADYGCSPEWHPVNLWRSIAPFIARLRDGQAEAEDVRNLDYYLYKWYYFNVTDLWREHRSQLRKDIAEMREEMKRAYPQYLRYQSVRAAMRAGDSSFARAAVLACWLTEKLHMLPLIVFARRIQIELRK